MVRSGRINSHMLFLSHCYFEISIKNLMYWSLIFKYLLVALFSGCCFSVQQKYLYESIGRQTSIKNRILNLLFKYMLKSSANFIADVFKEDLSDLSKDQSIVVLLSSSNPCNVIFMWRCKNSRKVIFDVLVSILSLSPK